MTAFKPPKLEASQNAGNAVQPVGRMLRGPLTWWPSDWANVDVLTVPARRGKVALVADFKVATEILLNRSGAFTRSRIHDRILAAGYGGNFVPDEQQSVREKRRDLAQSMAFRRALSLVPRLKKACETTCDEWANGDTAAPVDLLRDTRRLSLDALYRGLVIDDDAWQRRDAQIDAVAGAMADHASPTTGLLADLQELAPMAERIIASPDAYVETLPSDASTLMFFLHAGHHNSAATLAWSLWLLAHRPDLQAAIRAEAKAAQGHEFAFEAFPTTFAAMQETLRMFPPNFQLFREAGETTTAGGHHFEAGTTIILAIYAIHRHPNNWSDPDDFRPARFMEADSDERTAFSLVPFGVAGNACIGANLARIQMTLFISMICERFDLSPNPDSPLTCSAEWSLKPVGKAPIFVRPVA